MTRMDVLNHIEKLFNHCKNCEIPSNILSQYKRQYGKVEKVCLRECPIGQQLQELGKYMGGVSTMVSRVTPEAELSTPRGRKRWLRGQRKQLGWTYEEVARRLRCTIIEYQEFEIGKTNRCNGLTFQEIKEYMERHLETQVS